MDNVKIYAKAILYNALDITCLYISAFVFELQKVIYYISVVVNNE